MALEGLLARDVIGSFAVGQSLRAALLLTYSSDGRWFEEVLAPELFERRVETALLIRDANAILSEILSVRCHRADAVTSRIFHPKLLLLVSENRALAIIGSANLTRGGYEKNLELALPYEVGPEGGPKSIFRSLHEYLSEALPGEVVGTARATLRDIALAMEEVLRGVPDETVAPVQHLVFSHKQPIWDQVLEHLPHRAIRRAIIVSPFFEPDLSSVAHEDPPLDALDTSVFARLFGDFSFEPTGDEKPVSIYFQHDSGATLLPLEKISAWKQQIELHARRDDSQDPRRLHGKLLVLESARGRGRESFVVTLHGSPNFTAAALLHTAPEHNSELAVLTRLPARRNASGRIIEALGLADRFSQVVDWSTLRPMSSNRRPPPRPGPLAALDATLCVADGILSLSFRGEFSAGSTVRVSIQRDGAWSLLAEIPWNGENPMKLPVPSLMTTADASGVPALAVAQVRVELVDPAGASLAVRMVPLNVDCPQQFCGLVMTGPALVTLDQRIAQSGSGTPMTYREQQQWLEQLRAARAEAARAPAVLTHQADLDRFYRNLHTGFRGLRARQKALPGSEFTLRRNVRDLSRWLQEALTHESQIPGDACRLFLIDRLGRELELAFVQAALHADLASRLKAVAEELEIASAVKAAMTWLTTIPEPRLGDYVTQARRQLERAKDAMGMREAQP
jgi:hypothetical protein